MAGETQQTGQSLSSEASQQSSQNGGAQDSSSKTQTQNSSQQADGQTGQVAQTQQQAQPPARPAYVPETNWDSTAGKIKDEKAYADWVNGNAAAVAAENSRKLTLPQKPDDYKAEFTPAFKPPEGLGDPKKPLYGVMDPADPLLAQYRAMAHKRGLDQETFSEGLDMIAAIRVGEAAQFKAAYNAEVGKLGAAGPARIDALTQWLNAVGGPEAGALTRVLQLAPVADTVVAMEKLMQRFQSQGVTTLNNAHRADAPDAKKIAGYEKMSFEQRRFAQDQQRARATAR